MTQPELIGSGADVGNADGAHDAAGPVRKRRRTSSQLGKRADIQGLRMVAVLLVIASHLFEGARAGLVGVDVFFVISGFLITGLLLREWESTERISLSGFYSRRVRRIVPAATLTLVAATVAAFLLFDTYRFKQTVIDAVWAFLFSANWHFAFEGTNYLEADGPVSPIQHYWSLSVEEQFYFVWPGLILLVGLLVGRRWVGGRMRVIAGVMGVLVASSFAYALAMTMSNPQFGYFSSLARVWELGIGALLAISASAFGRIPGRLRPVLMWTGLAAIALGVVLPLGAHAFPLWQILLAVLGSSTVIIAGIGRYPKYSDVLTNRFSVYLGDISYSLYLWHWPVIVFLGVLLHRRGPFELAALLLTFGISIASYEFFENPIRHAKSLRGRELQRPEANANRRRRKKKKGKRSQTRLQRAAAASVALVTASVVVFVMSMATPRTTLGTLPPVAQANSQSEVNSEPELNKLSDEIREALRAEQWPPLTPSLDEVVSGRAASNIQECMGEAQKTIADCSSGSADAPKTVVMVGDSTSMSYEGAIETMVTASNGQWRAEFRNFIGCSFMAGHFRLPGFTDEAMESSCPDHVESTVSAIEAERPDLVVVTNGYWAHEYVASGREQTPAEREESIRSLVSRIAKAAGKVILLSPPPYSVDIRECFTRVSSPKDCVGSLANWWWDYERVDQDALKGMDNVAFIGSWRWFCSQDGLCPAFVGSTPVRYDTHHLIEAFSRKLEPVLREAFSQSGLDF